MRLQTSLHLCRQYIYADFFSRWGVHMPLGRWKSGDIASVQCFTCIMAQLLDLLPNFVLLQERNPALGFKVGHVLVGTYCPNTC